MLAAVGDTIEEDEVLRAQAAVPVLRHLLGEADDGVEWRAQLVGHPRQEVALRGIRLLRQHAFLVERGVHGEEFHVARLELGVPLRELFGLHVQLLGLLLQQAVALSQRVDGASQLELAHRRHRQFAQRLELFLRPLARRVVDGAEGAESQAVARREGDAGISHDVQLTIRQVVAPHRVGGGVADDELCPRRDDMLAERVRHGSASSIAGPPAQASEAREVLRGLVHERHEGNRHAEHA